MAYWISNAKHAQAHARARAPTPTLTYTRTHMPHLHSRTHAHANAHAEICNTYCFSTTAVVSWTRLNVTFYTYIACLVFNKINSSTEQIVATVCYFSFQLLLISSVLSEVFKNCTNFLLQLDTPGTVINATTLNYFPHYGLNTCNFIIQKGNQVARIKTKVFLHPPRSVSTQAIRVSVFTGSDIKNTRDTRHSIQKASFNVAQSCTETD